MRAGTILAVTALSAACSASPDAPPATETPVPSTAVPATPSLTPVALAARVNGEEIPLEAYQREVARYEASMSRAGIDLATVGDYRSEVLETLIDRKLLVQAALALGPDLTEAELEQIIADLDIDQQQDWLDTAGYAEVEFRAELREEKLAARMIEAIAGAIPAEVEQVHARHILVSSRAEAEILLQDLQAGLEFDLLARLNSLDPGTRPAGGDLGWFPQGVLTTPELEEIAFALQPGEISGVVETVLGFHILEVLERERRPLAGTALIVYRTAAVDRWLSEQRQSAAIEILVDE